MKNYELIDDPLCDVEGFNSYENCEDCPYFYECMEVKEDKNSERYDVQRFLEKGYHFINGESVKPPSSDFIKAILEKVLEHWDEEVSFPPDFDEIATNGFRG